MMFSVVWTSRMSLNDMEKYYDNRRALWGLKCGERRITEPLFLEVLDISGP